MFIYSNTAISLDGRIGTKAFDHVVLGTRTDRDYMSVLRARADAILVGGRTFRNWPLPLVPDPAAIARLQASGFPDSEVPELTGRTWWNVVVTRNFDIPKTGRFYQDPRIKPLFLTQTPGTLPAPLPGCIPGELEITPQVTIPWILAQLQKRGIQRVLLEAGGDLLAQFAEANALHGVYLTLCPKLVGGRGAPSLIDGPGFLPNCLPELKLTQLYRLQDELYLYYEVR